MEKHLPAAVRVVATVWPGTMQSPASWRGVNEKLEWSSVVWE